MTKRGFKKTAYGLLYASLWLLLVFVVYNSLFAAPPSCFDSVKNQDEEDVDCGGVCPACALRSLSDIEVKGPITLLNLQSGYASILARIVNPNSDYGAQLFKYRFTLYDKTDKVLQTIEQSDVLYPREQKIILAQDITTDPLRVARADIRFSDVEWERASFFEKPDLTSTAIQTQKEEDSVLVRGIVVNQSSFDAREVKIIAVLRDRFDTNLFASQTVLTKVGGLSQGEFVIFFPPDGDLSRSFDADHTQIFISVP